MASKSIPIGTVFGRLTVIGVAEPRLNPNGKHSSRSICQCVCGTVKPLCNGPLNTGAITACGCVKSERDKSRTQNSHKRIPEYRVWKSIKARCGIPSATGYGNYGGRGVTVCDRWKESFESFLTDMGPRPSPQHSIDRYPNNEGNYETGNCRWATRQEQDCNRRTNRLLTVSGITMTVSEWSRRNGIPLYTLINRLKSGWDPERAVVPCIVKS